MFPAYTNIVMVFKAAIVSSDSLKSATSKRVAIMYALAGFSFLLVYGFFDRSKREIDISSVHIATSVLVPLVRGTPGKPFSSSILSFSGSRDFSDHGTLHGYGFSACAILANSEPARLGLTSIDDSGPSNWRLPSIGIRGAQVIFSEAPSGSTWSLLETCLKLLLLFQGISGIVSSSLATVFALKVDFKVKELDLELKRLQIVQLQQQLDKQARERQKEIDTTASSGIVLISSLPPKLLS